jgi:leucyl-tRNA synthetase
MDRYEHQKIEQKWRERWNQAYVYKTTEDPDKPKFYILDMFPYPSGVGLHVGHPKGYIATDIISRYKRMTGYNVLHPMGWDAFGLPAEQYALKNHVHPKLSTDENIATYKKQLEKISLNYDWEREFSTTDPTFYKWTQWAFIQMFKKGLVFLSDEPINWCPSCKTGLANEDLEDGKCERCGSVIEKKKIPQWVIKITDYADRLLEDLDKLTWQDHIKELQRTWIGRSEGAKIRFKIKGKELTIDVFTTRPDTLFGATYMVLAPEHGVLSKIEDKILNTAEVKKYQEQTIRKTEIERTMEGREKTGVKLEGVVAINPANDAEIPIYIADYVLADYGTGAIMAVPAHDERDWNFAKKFEIDIVDVIEPLFVDDTDQSTPREDLPFIERGAIIAVVKHWKEDLYLTLQWKNIHWKTFVTGGIEKGQTPEEAARMEILEETGYKNLTLKKELGHVHSKFFHNPKNENRFAHFTALYFELDDNARDTVSEMEQANHDIVWMTKDEVIDNIEQSQKFVFGRIFSDDVYTGNGLLINSGEFDGMESEEAKKAITEKVGGEMTVSYKLRDWVFSRQRYWGEPIPLIHCVQCGVVPVPENELPLTLPEVESYEPTGTGESPLAAISEWVNTRCPECGGGARRETNTMPQWAGSSWYHIRYIDPHNDDALVDKEKEKYWDPVDFYVGGAEHATRHLIYARFWHKFLYDIGVVHSDEPYTKLQTVGLILAEDGRKMSKRWGNVINPDDVIDRYGSDTFRLYEMFMGPFDATVAWSTDGLIGPRKFLERIWKIYHKGLADTTSDVVARVLHQTIKKVSEDIETMKYNTAIAQMMIFVNTLEKDPQISAEDFGKFLMVLSPFAPHMTQELWSEMGHDTFLIHASWPEYDPAVITDDEIVLVVQVNGKVRDKIMVAANISEDDAKEQVMASEKVQKHINGKEVRKVIFIKGRLINIVV